MARVVLALAVAAILSILVYAQPAGAAGYATVYIDAKAPVEASLNGSSYILEPGLNRLPAPGLLCLSPASLVVYDSPGERLVFKAWLGGDGRVYTEEPCTRLGEGGYYRAYYEREYLVVVESSPQGVYSAYAWVPEGGLFELSAPERVGRGGFVYVLSGWEAPPAPGGAVAVTKSLTVKAVYRVLVVVETPNGTIAVPAGVALADLARAAGWLVEVPAGDGIRLVLEGFKVNGSLVPARDAAGTRINAPARVEPVYVREYRVEVRTPAAARVEWVREGSTIQLAAPSSIQVNDTVRLAFVEWRGPNGTVIRSPAVAVEVEGPGVYEAVYAPVYRVRIEAPFGSSTIWARAGEVVPITQPQRLPGVVYDRVLVYYIVNGQTVEPGEGGLLMLTVTRPTTVVAVYTVKANIMHLAVLASFLLSIAAAYIAYNLFTSTPSAPEEEGREYAYGTTG